MNACQFVRNERYGLKWIVFLLILTTVGCTSEELKLPGNFRLRQGIVFPPDVIDVTMIFPKVVDIRTNDSVITAKQISGS